MQVLQDLKNEEHDVGLSEREAAKNDSQTDY